MKSRQRRIIFLLFFILLSYSCRNQFKKDHIKMQEINPIQADMIYDITDSLVVPYVYQSIFIDGAAQVKERKKDFVNQLLPSILIVKHNLEKDYNSVKALIEKKESNHSFTSKEKHFLDELFKTYKTRNIEHLRIRLKPHPASLVLAQAAVESGWGTSRFTKEGNNLFGVWTSATDENQMKSKFDREDGQEVYVKKYETILESVEHYYLNIARHGAYLRFRELRDSCDNPNIIAEGLINYSEKGEEYVVLMRNMIRWNKFMQYDHYQIDPKYIK